MGLLSLFTGKPPEELETVADDYLAAGEYGAAKVEYDKALEKAEKKHPEKQPLIRRLTEKARNARESLAAGHVEKAGELIASNELQGAEDLLRLAFELSGSESLKARIRESARQIHQQKQEQDLPETGDFLETAGPDTEADTEAGADAEAGAEAASDDAEHFHILVSALPETLQDAYEGYGREFQKGYIALNQGDFKEAVECFQAALAENPSVDNWIPLELATAYLNLSEPEKARETMESYIRNNPESLRGYQLLCDIYWEMADFQAAEALLSNCPDELKQTASIRMLLGETFYQAGQYAAARDVFMDCDRQFGNGEMINRALAKTYEAIGDLDSARERYGQILNGCTSCGARVDPFIKYRFAELSFQQGDTSTKVLEMFLSLVREDPDNRREYFDRIAKIYEAGGHTEEARRYQAFTTSMA